MYFNLKKNSVKNDKKLTFSKVIAVDSLKEGHNFLKSKKKHSFIFKEKKFQVLHNELKINQYD